MNNGTSNVFSELEPASYNFRVIDFCGNAVNRIFDVNGLKPIKKLQSTDFVKAKIPPYQYRSSHSLPINGINRVLQIQYLVLRVPL